MNKIIRTMSVIFGVFVLSVGIAVMVWILLSSVNVSRTLEILLPLAMGCLTLIISGFVAIYIYKT